VIEAGDIETAVVRKPVKSDAAFRTISEVSVDLDVPQHVLRFWESKFPQIKPLKRGGGRRYYRPEDLLLLRHIRDLLYKDGYTIRGVQKLLRDQSRGPIKSTAKTATSVIKESVEPDSAVANVSSNDVVAGVSVPDVAVSAVAFVPPDLLLDVAPQQDGASDIRAELKSLLVELEELRALLSQARQN